jgi:ribonuclease D
VTAPDEEKEDDERRNISLGKACLELLGKDICKAERMSNWERRPLR